MGSISETSIWPESIRGGPTQKTIERFCELADDPTHDGSLSFGNLFMSTGELVARGHVCKGYDDLVRFRDGAWDLVGKRKHTIHKVYVSHQTKTDVLVLGRVTFGHRDGRSVTQEFQGNFSMEEDTGLIRRYQAWLDSKPLADLIAGAELED